MGAFVDRTVRCIIRYDKKKTVAGARPIGKSFLFETESGHFVSIGGSEIELPQRQNGVKTWLVCSHLDTPEKFITNYLRNRYFVVFDSHVFCHDCNENNMLGSEAAFSKMEKESSALTDKELQRQIFDPLFELNLRFGNRTSSRPELNRRSRTWCVCNHLANEDNFRRHVFNGNLILFTEYNVTCPDCLDFAIKGPRCHDDDKLVSMPDDDFQCAIVDTLYSVNYELSMAQGFIGSLE
ncbi:MAG: hypothetical protein WBV95_21445 [Desulfobacterales bacterium]